MRAERPRDRLLGPGGCTRPGRGPHLPVRIRCAQPGPLKRARGAPLPGIGRKRAGPQLFSALLLHLIAASRLVARAASLNFRLLFSCYYFTLFYFILFSYGLCVS